MKSNDGAIVDVENMIYKESRERIRDLMMVYQALREAAIDCKVLKEFHMGSVNPVGTCL